MADEKTREGNRLGPFLIGRRFKRVRPETGRLYRARNVHTGAAALVLLPGEDLNWELAEGWKVQAFSQKTPAYLALEVKRAPGSSRLTELVRLLDMLSNALQEVCGLTEAQDHLTRAPRLPPEQRSSRPVWRWLGAGLAALAVWAVALGVALSAYSRTADAGPGLSASGVHEFTNQFSPEQAAGIAYPLPAKPFDGQAKAPCDARAGQVEINGGCWLTLEKRPPCFDRQAEHQGKCYMPVGERPKARQSAGQ